MLVEFCLAKEVHHAATVQAFVRDVGMADWFPLVTAASSFAGATMAQILSHHLIARREQRERWRRGKSLTRHMQLDALFWFRNLEKVVGGMDGLAHKGETYPVKVDPVLIYEDEPLAKVVGFDESINPFLYHNDRGMLWREGKIMKEIYLRLPAGRLSYLDVCSAMAIYKSCASLLVACDRWLEADVDPRAKHLRISLQQPNYAQLGDAFSRMGTDAPSKEVFAKVETFLADMPSGGSEGARGSA